MAKEFFMQTAQKDRINNKTMSSSGELNFLRGLPDQLVEEVLPFSRTLFFLTGEEFRPKNSEKPAFYYVKKGSIEVSHTAHDTKITVALIGSGNFFGEIGYFDGGSRVRDIRITEDAEIRVFDQSTMKCMQKENPLLYGYFLDLLTRGICIKFRRILEEREPLRAYGASLSTRKKDKYEDSAPLPEKFFETAAWRSVNRIVEDFKGKMYNISYRLQEDSSTAIAEEVREQCLNILNQFYVQILNLKKEIQNLDEENYAWGYLFKEIYPYFMRSRFAERVYFKPKGYAGDFLMIEKIYQNKPAGDGKLGVIVDEWCLNSIGSKAIRGRRKLLSRQLAEISNKKYKKGHIINIMNLACGPNQELFDFLRQCDYTEAIEALCIDIDSEALQYTNKHVNTFPHNASIRLMNENLVKWSLGRVNHNMRLQDIIYSAGLTDYLEDKLFVAFITRCYHQLKPGGVLIVGNFSPNPDQPFMDHILQWRLHYRNREDLTAIFSQSPFADKIEILSEKQGVNLFVKAVRPD